MECGLTLARQCSFKQSNEKYRATVIWKDLVMSFRARVVCKKKRRHLKSFENCFSGSSAVNKLFQILQENENFPQEITKEQAVKLLQKFLSEHVLEAVDGQWENETFSDSSKLYRFADWKDGYANTTPTKNKYKIKRHHGTDKLTRKIFRGLNYIEEISSPTVVKKARRSGVFTRIHAITQNVR
ncbi:DEP domain-containing protein 1B-like [Styela clava]